MIKLCLVLLSFVLVTSCIKFPEPDYYILYSFKSKETKHELDVDTIVTHCIRVQGEMAYVEANDKILERINNTYDHVSTITVETNISSISDKRNCNNWLRLDDFINNDTVL